MRLKFDNANFGENSNLQLIKVIDLGANRKLICNFLLDITCNFSRICYHFQDIATYWSKIATPLYYVFGAPIKGEAIRFMQQPLVTKKLEWWAYQIVKEFWWYVQPFDTNHACDGQTDGIGVAYAPNNIYAVMGKNQKLTIIKKAQLSQTNPRDGWLKSNVNKK